MFHAALTLTSQSVWLTSLWCRQGAKYRHLRSQSFNTKMTALTKKAALTNMTALTKLTALTKMTALTETNTAAKGPSALVCYVGRGAWPYCRYPGQGE